MKKLIAMALTASMALGLAACGSSSSSTTDSSSAATSAATSAQEASTEAPAAAATEAPAASTEAAATGDASGIKVAMITDYGDITDMSFNQTTYEACKSWAADNGTDFTYYKPEGDSDAEREAMIDKAVSDGYNVVVMPGYAFAQAVTDEVDMYPDVKFVALDVSQSDLDSTSGETGFARDNLYCAIYQEELPGYMAGYAAVKMGYKKLGFLGGMAVPAVIRYGFGYVQGADAAAKELGISDVSIEYAYANQFYGDADITAAMDTWYQGGTEVVFACGGGVYTSACEAAAKVDGKVIGVDVDQKETIDGQYGDGMCITSAVKGLRATVVTLLDAIRDGNWDDYKGQVQNLGIVSDDPDENYVGLPEDSTVWTDGFTDDDYRQLVKDMHSGAITVSNDTSAMPEVSNVTVDDQGNLK
ncbi:MAG: BMP family ABC transporter substrate-binding protein [Lachnospiraceae bacterium]|jgi:basic membrane protein A|nr:BMP family ABC transporter substrate-binding protein [Lachnospiraceae bacterium]MCI1424560.1 BMP family ABC transporter substrate-binding protein [Lachnospiraceae bacterium]MCI1453319.1 BMP family ABC transporter substrate-binding protein [Lachnospiraceae bacterium]